MAKTITNPTNIEIATELCKSNPTSKYASLLGYDAETGELGVKDLSLFETATPEIANEFIGDMANKIVVQRAYDLFRGYEMPFKSFMRSMSRLGDAEELLTATLATPKDYDASAEAKDPFSATKPTIKLAWLKTEDRKVVDVLLSYEIWAGAFVSENGLSNMAGIILKNLRDSIEEYIRDAVKTDLADEDKVTTEMVVTALAGAGETANAQRAYEEILKLVRDMSIPNTLYNNAGVKTFTPMGRAVLILNTRYASAFDVNVLASLFNAGEIATKKYFKEVIVTDFGDETTIGAVLDDEAYLWGNRIDMAQSIANPKTLEINTYYHRWLKRAVVPFRQAVRLVTTATVPSEPSDGETSGSESNE